MSHAAAGSMDLGTGISELADWAKKALKRQPPDLPSSPLPNSSPIARGGGGGGGGREGIMHNHTNSTTTATRGPHHQHQPPAAAEEEEDQPTTIEGEHTPTVARSQPKPIIPARPTRGVGAASPPPPQSEQQHQQDPAEEELLEDDYEHAPPASDNIWTSGAEEDAPRPARPPPAAAAATTRSKVIRFRVVKLSKTGMYTEKVLAVDTQHHVLLFQDPATHANITSEGSLSPRGKQPPQQLQMDSEKGFAMSDIKAILPFDDAASTPSAPMPGAGSFHSRLLLLFQPELLHRSYELLFADPVQRNVFVAVVQELYGVAASSKFGAVEIMHVDTAPLGPTPLGSIEGSKGPKWIPDADVTQCMSCRTNFTMMFRKHHCRSCGGIFCGPCSDHNASLPDLSYSKPVRVCNACFRLICDVRKQGLMIANAAIHLPPTGSPYGADGNLVIGGGGKRGSFTTGTSGGLVATYDHPARMSPGVESPLIRPVFLPPQLARAHSSPLSPGSSGTTPKEVASFQSVGGGKLEQQQSQQPTRDIYGFLLSSPTLALAPQNNSGRDQTVLQVNTQSGEYDSNSSTTGNMTERGSSDAADRSVSTLPSPPSQSTSSSAGMSPAAAAFQATIHAQQQSRLAAQHLEFDAARERWNKYLVLHTHIDRHSTELKRLVRKGIPPELRGQIWQILSGSRERQLQVQQQHARRMQSQIALRTTAAMGNPNAAPGDAPPSRENIKDVNYYQHCLACAQVPSNLTISVAEIDKDLHRTFPDNILFSENVGTPNPAAGASGNATPASAAGKRTAPAPPTPSSSASTPTKSASTTLPVPPAVAASAGLSMLRRVLLAYSFHNPAIGYCQSMNFITAMLLLFMEEEEAFYMLQVILEELCCVEVSTSMNNNNPGAAGEAQTPPDPSLSKTLLYYHSPDLAGAHIDSKVFLDLILEKLPKIASHLEKLSFPLAPLTMSWLLCLFVNSLPLDTTLVLWDILFSEGVKILFRASLTLLKVHEKSLLRCNDFEEVLMVLKTCPGFHPTVVPSADGFGTTSLPPIIDTAGFVRICFDPLWLGSFPMQRITALRNYHRLQVEADLAARKAKVKQSKEKAQERERVRLEKLKSAITSPIGEGTAERRKDSAGTASPTPATQDPSVAFALSSSPSHPPSHSHSHSLEKQRQLSLFSSVLPTPVIEGFYASPSPPTSLRVNSAGGALDSDSDYVAILAPTSSGASPRMVIGDVRPTRGEEGEARRKEEGIQVPEPDLAASPHSHAPSPAADVSTPPPRPARPPKSAVKRASLTYPQQASPTEKTAGSDGDTTKAPVAQAGAVSSHRAPGSNPSTPPRSTRPLGAGPTNSPPKSSSAAAAPPSSSPSMFSTVLSSVGRALTQVGELLTEDERNIAERARREKEQSAAHHARARSASGTGAQGHTPPHPSHIPGGAAQAGAQPKRTSSGAQAPLSTSPALKSTMPSRMQRQ